jgi:flagellar capping protein FliD
MATITTSSFSSPTSSTGQFSVGGLASGLDTKSIIDGLVALEQQKVTLIDRKKNRIAQQQAAFKGVESRLLGLQGQMTQFARSQNGIFEARAVQSSNTDLVTAAASSSATAGVYRLRVNALAKADQVASQGFDAATSGVSHGTVQLTIGDKTTTITIDSTNDTLQGLASAINNSDAAVSATVVNDGSGANKQGFRLLLTAESAGTSNAIKITNQLDASNGSLTRPVFDAATIGRAAAAANNTSSATAQSNAGSGYTGTANNLYTFRVVAGGVVGTDDNIQLSYTDATGANTGTITLNSGDANVLKTAAQGVGVQFAAGTLVAGDSFQIKAFVPTVQAASDASVTLGSGDGALTITNSGNQIDALIPGVALQLQNSDPGQNVTITVTNDTDKIKKSIGDFVSAFNETMKFIDQQTSYAADTGQAGPLLGNRLAITIQNQIRTSISNVVAGANPAMNHLGALGIKTDKDGQLVVDDAKLNNALNGGIAGVTLADVRKLFSLSGSSPNSGIQFVTGSVKTVASTTPYTVEITQAAEKATLTATDPLAESTVISVANNELNVTIDGKAATSLKLAVGTYTRTALAQAVQAAINSSTDLAGRTVSASVVGNRLTIASDRFGIVSQVAFQTGSALAALGLTDGSAAQGRDVAGRYVVNGTSEAAVGSGQFLVGDSTNSNTADLQIRVLLTPDQVGTGISSSVNVTRGIASRLDRELNNVFDPFNGRLKVADDGFDAAIESLTKQSADQTDRIAAKRDQLTKQFTAMESALSQLQGASNFLTTQSNSSK